MKALVGGYASIGAKHARILKALDCETAVVSARRIDFEPRYSSLSEAIKKEAPQYVVIANKTAEHYPTLCELEKNGFKGVVLIEKPLFSKPEKARKFSFKKIFVAYNLRFHPVIHRLKELLRQAERMEGKVTTVLIFDRILEPPCLRLKAEWLQGWGILILAVRVLHMEGGS